MKLFRKVLSAMLSCAVVGSVISSSAVSAFAEDAADLADTTINDSINQAESKEETTIPDEVLLEDSTAESPFNVFDIYTAHQGYVAANSGVEPFNGIDVSEWQGDIDWAQVKDSGKVDYVIVRAGYGNLAEQKDKKFDENMQGAQDVGLPCGTYWYSYALSPEEAVQEAEVCYEIIKDYDFKYPVFFDIEDPSQMGLTIAQISAIVESFCRTLRDKGYYVGVYSYANLLNTHIYASVLNKYDVWVAHFDVPEPELDGSYQMWQYTSKGYVDGINGLVDLDYSYVNYPYKISPETYEGPIPDENAIGPKTSSAPVDTGLARGIDVSAWQGEIEWETVKSAGVDFAIIRAGYGQYTDQKDKFFDVNMAGAKAAGLGVGVYWYCYADTPERAVREAEACYEIIKDYKLDYPVYYDIEDSSISRLSEDELSEIADAFCSTMESKGYYTGITSYTNFLNMKFSPEVFRKYDIWVAHYGVNKPGYGGNYGIWQYTSTGRVNGIVGAVDMDYCYKDYPSIMEYNGLNGY
jgi:GH25 family lysozyme M1 (1,4-beta-N-acetylmuramidase)